jgi:hypothetical protein
VPSSICAFHFSFGIAAWLASQKWPALTRQFSAGGHLGLQQFVVFPWKCVAAGGQLLWQAYAGGGSLWGIGYVSV